MNLSRTQSGITLIELMIAMILGLLVSGAIITIFITNVKSATENIKMIHLNQELRTVMGFMSDEIKRAGYSASSDEDYMGAWSTATAGCIIYSYDQNGDGSAYAAGTDRLGFKLDNGVIKWGSSVTSCTLPALNWQPLTDTGIANITLFTITAPAIVAGTLNIRQVTVTITGEIALKPGTATRTITETIRVRNEDDT
jgi:type II secretory pathway component PulJ